MSWGGGGAGGIGGGGGMQKNDLKGGPAKKILSLKRGYWKNYPKML